MTIRELLEIGLFDENEQVVVIGGNVGIESRLFTGRLVDIPEELLGCEVFQISAMGETRKAQYHLNEDGCLELWVIE